MVAVLVLAAFSAVGNAGAQTTPAITSPPPPAGVVGQSYAHQFTSNLTQPAASYAVTAGTLPPNVTLADMTLDGRASSGRRRGRSCGSSR